MSSCFFVQRQIRSAVVPQHQLRLGSRQGLYTFQRIQSAGRRIPAAEFEQLVMRDCVRISPTCLRQMDVQV